MINLYHSNACSLMYIASLKSCLIVYGAFYIFQSDYSSSDVFSAIQNICTCFGVGGLYNAKKRYVVERQ